MKRPPLDSEALAAVNDPSAAVDATISHTGASANAPDVTLSLTAATDAGASVATPPAEAARYVVEREVARGGLGRVLKAHDERLDRPVAVKESLASGGLLDERFRREAAITARLQHPSIVPVYDAGTWPNGAPYYVMKLLGDSSTLKQLVADAHGLDARLALLPHIIAVADAVAYAHSLGIIHRDLKPSNVLVGPFGETLVIDWGLAKDLSRPSNDDAAASEASAAAELTSHGSIIGTPQYMAPEQARGEPVDKRADVYALGALLYFVLSGEPPYRAESSGAVLDRVRSQEPIALSAHAAAIPSDLVAIVHKAMARAPADRYASAGELVDDLKRFQTGQLVGAHVYSLPTLLLRFIGRHRAPLAVALVFLVASTVLGLLAVRRIARARDLADEQRAVAVEQRAAAEGKRNELILLQAHASLEQDPTKAMAWLKSYPLDGSDWPTVQALASHAASLGVAHHLLPTGMVVNVRRMHDGRRLVICGANRQITVWDVEHGVALDRITLADTPFALASSPDDSTIAVSTIKGVIYLWHLPTHRVQELGREDGGLTALQFSPDGKLLATSGGKEFGYWSVADRSFHGLAGAGHPGRFPQILFTKDGQALYSMGDDGSVHRTTLATGVSTMFAAHKGPIIMATLSDDDELLATAGSDGTARLWPTRGGAGRLLQTSPTPVSSVSFLPQSHRLATVSDRYGFIWDADAGRLLAQSPQQPVAVSWQDLSADGALLALGGAGSLQVWRWSTGQRAVLPTSSSLLAVSYTSDGNLVTGGRDRETRVWATAMLPVVPLRVGQLSSAPTHLAIAPDGAHFAVTAGPLGHICAVDSGECRPLAGHAEVTYGVAYSPDGAYVATAGWDRTARLWRVADGSARVLAVGGDLVDKVLFSPDGHDVLAACSDGSIYSWPVAGGGPTVLSGHAGDVHSIAISPDGRLLASAGEDKSVRLWDRATGRGQILGTHAKGVFVIAFSPDGRLLASGSADGTVRLWTVAGGAGREVAQLHERISALEFSPDGRFVAAASWSGTTSVWNLATARAQLLRGHEGRVRALAWSHDSRQLATGSDDKSARIWNVETGAVDVLPGFARPVIALGFLPNGSLITTCGDGSFRIWPADRAPAAPREPAALMRWMANVTSATVH